MQFRTGDLAQATANAAGLSLQVEALPDGAIRIDQVMIRHSNTQPWYAVKWSDQTYTTNNQDEAIKFALLVVLRTRIDNTVDERIQAHASR